MLSYLNLERLSCDINQTNSPTQLACMKMPKQGYAPSWSRLLITNLFLFFSVAAYTQTITGTVSSAPNQPLTGATVQVKNTNRATVTDDNGQFRINASGNDVLVISSVGYKQLEVPVDGRNNLVINLESGTVSLDEVVVTA